VTTSRRQAGSNAQIRISTLSGAGDSDPLSGARQVLVSLAAYCRRDAGQGDAPLFSEKFQERSNTASARRDADAIGHQLEQVQRAGVTCSPKQADEDLFLTFPVNHGEVSWLSAQFGKQDSQSTKDSWL